MPARAVDARFNEAVDLNESGQGRNGAQKPEILGHIRADVDPTETREWLESFEAVLEQHGADRARYLLSKLIDSARANRALPDGRLVSDYINTIPSAAQPSYPGDLELERRIRRIVRWNAAAMVTRANNHFGGLGGHISTYASAASLYEVGFNHFFRGKDGEGSGDQIYFQGHAAPGVYSRSFLEGSLSEDALEHFRREVERGRGLSSYPHPRLMPDYWEFPTVSMGLGPISAIYQARFNRYLHARGLKDTSESRVWAFLGDGETDEPESLGSLSIAAREGLDNLTFVVNCNLQRLDGPVRGNGKIIQELESVFRGAGWNVIKVIWGTDWDPLFAKDRNKRRLVRVANEVPDGEWQRVATLSGAEIRKDFFERHGCGDLIDHLDDEALPRLRRGGHDMLKIYAAYKQAVETKGRPTAILAHTVKGWTLGEGFEAKNVTHQMKKLKLDELRAFRDRLNLPISDKNLEDAPLYHPGADSPEVRYLKERREALGGQMPKRKGNSRVFDVKLPEQKLYNEFYEGTADGKDGVSTTIAFVRLLSKLIRDEGLGKYIVPIIPDEARTFGMDPFFRMVGIYASKGQLYEPVDAGLLLYYREAEDGQVLEEGITEAGSMASFQAAGTAYSTHDVPMVPFYTFYSMFGFQRTGDQIWQFGDARGRGFLLGATAGRTTLNGEGLQHADGHSQILASTVANIQAYDPAFAYEIALIVQDGLRRMVGEHEDVFYYVTLQNENYPMPKMPNGVEQGVLKGCYRFQIAKKRGKQHVQLFGSGSIMNEVLRARDLLMDKFGVSADIWSVTSYQQLRRDALACERWNRLHPSKDARVPYVAKELAGIEGPFVAASDYLKQLPELIGRWVPGTFVPLGTDGYGMSDTRDALRRHFEVDAEAITVAALDALRQDGKLPAKTVERAIQELGIDPEKLDPTTV